MNNSWQIFDDLIPHSYTFIGEVQAHVGTKSRVISLDGKTSYAQGTGVAVGNRAYVTDGVVVDQAPSDMPVYDLQV